MSPDHRRYPRVERSLSARWEAAGGSQQVRVVDISRGGCFIEARACNAVALGSATVLHLEHCRIPVVGQIVYIAPNIGFGLKFVELGIASAREIARLADVSAPDHEPEFAPEARADRTW